jgi:hypothetical protein
MQMSELAYTINGEAFDLPATASAWRIRRMKQRGAPEVVYSREGVPQTISVEAGLEELRQVVGQPGKYRLDAIDDHGKTIEKLPAAYVIVPPREGDEQPANDNRASDNTPVGLMAEAMRMNTELAKAVIDRFPQMVEAANLPQMVEAAASLLRAADGAGLPKREPRAVVDDDDDETPPTPAPVQGGDIYTLLGPVVQMFAASLFGGGIKMPGGLGAILDWRKAAPQKQITDKSAAETATSDQKAAPAASPAATASTTDSQTDALPPLDPAMMQHFLAIQAALGPNEALLAREVARDLGPAKLRAWFDELGKLSVPDAVARIRELLGSQAKGGAA